MRYFRAIFGAVVWIAAVCLVWTNLSSIISGPSYRTIRELKRFWADQCATARLELPIAVDVEVGDPVFVRDGSGGLRQVGEVLSILQGTAIAPIRRAQASAVQIFFFPDAPVVGSEAEFTYFASPDSLAWIVESLLTPERKELIAQAIHTAYEQYRVEIWTTLQPVMDGTLRDGWAVVEQDLPAAIERHAPELQALGGKYEQEIVNQELLPLAREEIWPIVQSRAEPVVESVGMELWERVSFWRFGWRAAYDRSPLPDRHLLEHEWQRFVRHEAMPILSRHTGDMIEIVRGVIQDASRNEAVQAGVRNSVSRVAADPEFQQLVYDIFEEVFILNPRLRDVLQRRWTGPEAQQALQVASDLLEPTVHHIAYLLFGSFEQGITPQFAQVLRSKILAKDQRWFLLELQPDDVLPRQQGAAAFTAKVAEGPAAKSITITPRIPFPARSTNSDRESGEGP
jgi:hypothetical protein